MIPWTEKVKVVRSKTATIGPYELRVTATTLVAGGKPFVRWKVSATGINGAEGEASDVEDAEARCAKALGHLQALASMKEAVR